MWLPQSLYKALPFVYTIAGAALFPIFGFTGPSMCSAILLMSAGMLTLLWRYRSQDEESAPPDMRDEWEKRKLRRTENMPLDGFQ